jgi:uncharacterized DUF497 family protein
MAQALFDWDDANRTHIARHRVTPAEAEQVIHNNPIDLTVQGCDGEDRILQVGATDKGRVLLVVTTWRNDKIRVVTAHPAPKKLRLLYIQNNG